MKDLVIIGAGGFGREVKELVDEINEKEPTWNFLGYYDDTVSGETIESDKIIGTLEDFLLLKERPLAVISVANPAVRKQIAKRCETFGVKYATLIHPTVRIKGDLVTIGEGSIIQDGSFLAVNCHLGKHSILNFECGIGHDTNLGDFFSSMSCTQIAGEVNIGECCYFGLHCTVINRLNITENCTFGAGAVVVKDAEVSGTYVGVPAKCIKPLAK